MTGPVERRRFIAALLKNAGKAAVEGHETIGQVRGEIRRHVLPGETIPDPEHAVPSPTRMVASDELNELATAAGLGHRLDDVAAAHRVSLRVMPVTERAYATGRTQFGGGVVPRDEITWPHRGGRPLSLLLQLDLTALDRGLLGPLLPPSGFMLFFYDAGPATTFSCNAGAVQVVSDGEVATGPPERQLATLTRPAALLPEVVLPRAWSEAIAHLDLEPSEQESWQDLRAALAEAQGVPASDRLTPDASLHRIGGFPDEKTGDMPLLCEIHDRGLEVRGSPFAHPDVESVRRDSLRWKLLLQLTLPEHLQGLKRTRIYFWTRRAGVAASPGDVLSIAR